MKVILYTCSVLLFFFACSKKTDVTQEPIHTKPEFKIFHDRVEQGSFVAKAISDTEIVSDYQSPANQFQSPRIDFKFSINAKDNEMVSGTDHHINCLSADGICKTPLIEFGKQFNDQSPIPADTYLKANTQLVIQLDMRHVFSAFDEKGFFETFNGEKIFKEDFKGVYVAGSKAPLTWDFDNLMRHRELQLTDNDGDHVYTITLILNPHDEKKVASGSWKLKADLSSYPTYSSAFPLADAVYNLSLEEMIRAVEPDSTFRTGKEWAGVWTRDISYSIILSMAVLQPKVAQHSLMRKVKDGVIIQDTGTGGAYPISTDRVIWAVAAWELYHVTGDKAWLKTAYDVVRKSLDDDLNNAFDASTGLVRGESSFLDWREQTYPLWMQPADIFESECLGTNAVHYQAHTILAKMAAAFGDKETESRHAGIANKIKEGINKHLWIGDNGYYGQFLYGRNFKSLSPRSEALGEALCVLFGVADDARAKQVVKSTPVTSYGIPCLYPQIPNIPPYHNNATWPFVQTFWTMACAKTGNETGVVEGISAIYRPTALFLTNKENFVSATGDYVGTQINSDNMLWSLSGNIALVYKVLFGMSFEEDGLAFHPFVPEVFSGTRKLENFKYRNAVIDVAMSGFGNTIKSMTLDGAALSSHVVPSTLTGKHVLKIELSDNKLGGEVSEKPFSVSPEAPVAKITGGKLSWSAIDKVHSYRVIVNGKRQHSTDALSMPIQTDRYSEYQLIAVSDAGVESFASEPVAFSPGEKIIEVEDVNPKSKLPYKGFSGKGFVEIQKVADHNKQGLVFIVRVDTDGIYALDFRYANGNGPVNTENKCAIRTLIVDKAVTGSVVFPQRGAGEWSDWGFSNTTHLELKKGEHRFELIFTDHNQNMNGEINQAMVDCARMIKIN